MFMRRLEELVASDRVMNRECEMVMAAVQIERRAIDEGREEG
jgi:hypothetical protein